MENTTLAPYACQPSESRGRLYPEAECGMRSSYQRDRDRIIHSAAFRRLEYKTQVFVNHEGDHYRTRLTHSLEVSQIARSLAKSLGLHEELAEALALAHDLGHPPFGHAGEDGLNAAMAPFGGFDHNAQTIRIVSKLEHRYAEFDGLNLTWELLEGIAKHNGPVMCPLPAALAEYNARHDLELHSYASLEAQVAAWADDIAYNNHDIDDGLRAGLFTLEDLCEVPEIAALVADLLAHYPGLAPERLRHELLRRLINRMCMDLLKQTQANIAKSGVKSAAEIRALGRMLVEFSPEMQAFNLRLKDFLKRRMYRHYKVNRMSSRARRVTGELFAFFHAEPECLPTPWFAQTEGMDEKARARIVCDFIAGMTDRFAIEEHRKVFGG